MRLRIKDFSTKVGSGVTPRGGAEVYQESGIPLYRSQNVTDDGFITDGIARISKEIDEEMSGTRIKPGDVLLNITGASIGRCYYTSDDFKCGNVNQHVCIIRPKRNIVLPAYLHLLLVSKVGKEYIKLSQTGSGREGLTSQEIRNFSFEIPSLPVQQRIVSYLDDKTAKIDHAVSLLQKKRDAYTRLKSSIINRAVTRGLNPNAQLKDSGVDWIGMIPENWKVKRLKDISILDPLCKESKFGSVSFVPMESLRCGEVDFKTITFENGIGRYNYFENGDLLIAKVTPCFENGNIAIATGLIQGIGFGSSEIFVLRTDSDKLLNKFMFYVSFSEHFKAKACSTMHGVGGLRRIDPIFMKTYELSLPPKEEQQAIANYLDTHCSRIDRAISIINKQIDAYTRLKKSLINEVVTGKRSC